MPRQRLGGGGTRSGSLLREAPPARGRQARGAARRRVVWVPLVPQRIDPVSSAFCVLAEVAWFPQKEVVPLEAVFIAILWKCLKRQCSGNLNRKRGRPPRPPPPSSVTDESVPFRTAGSRHTTLAACRRAVPPDVRLSPLSLERLEMTAPRAGNPPRLDVPVWLESAQIA